MPLSIGTRVGPYEITGAIGAGGMGEVFRARDTKLNRDVAIKVLPAEFASDHERVARFKREAQILASLNHPNIAAIYGLDEAGSGPGSGTTVALIMELVEGEDLAARLKRGPIPVDEAIAIARQIAEALEEAHERGIIHRDLKPANIKVTPDGKVKVLDFGLAKAMEGAASGAGSGSNSDHELSHSPTLTHQGTQAGMIMGTAAYMSPEQARGKTVDRRADIWAFGVVLFEMLTGARVFSGETVSDVLAVVLTRDPDWTVLPARVPAAVRTLAERCLERDPKQRLRDIGEARLLLSNPVTMSGRAVEPQAETWPSRHGRAVWFVAAAATFAAVVIGGLWAKGSSASAASDSIEALIAPPAGTTIGAGFALSPDGQRLVMTVVDRETGVSSLWVRTLASGTPVLVPQTTGASLPFWSPDGTQIAFFADGKLKKTDLQGSPPQAICDAPSPRGGAWGSANRMVLSATFRSGLDVVDAGGGTPRALTTFDDSRSEKSHRWPVFIDDDHLLFVAQVGEAGAKDDASTIEALTISTGVRTRLVTANSSPLYSKAGFILFWREGALRAQAFDPRKLTVSGAVFPVAPGLEFDTNEMVYASVSPNGRLVLLPDVGTARSTLMVVNRQGQPVKTIAESVMVEGGLALSHDGTRMAASITATGARSQDIWLYDLHRGTAGPLTFEEGSDLYQVWSPDDRFLVYANDRKNDVVIYRRSADGRGQPEMVGSNVSGFWPFAWSADGSWLVVGAVANQTGLDLLRFDLKDQKLTPLAQSQFGELTGALSPRDQWLAYSSDETGRREVYVSSLSGDGSRWQVSTQGGAVPMWRGDGRELYFIGPQNRLMAVDVEPGTTFRFSTPRELFKAIFSWMAPDDIVRPYAPMPDGRQFAVNVLQERSPQLLTLITDWTSAAKQ